MGTPKSAKRGQPARKQREMARGSAFNAYEVLRIAIEMEEDGIAFYEALAAAVRDEAVRDLAGELVEEEEDHIRSFRELVNAEELDNAWNADYLNMLDDYLAATVRREVYPGREAAKAIGKYARNLDEAFSLAIHLELRTVEYYEKLRAECGYPTGSQALAQIVKEEKEHAAKLGKARAGAREGPGTSGSTSRAEGGAR